MEEPAEIENAWNGIRTGDQVQNVSGISGYSRLPQADDAHGVA
jgi:hypothetical protein